MPARAVLSTKEAWDRVVGGELAYSEGTRDEPLFVHIDAWTGKFTTKEASTSDVTACFSDLADDLGFAPGRSGTNSLYVSKPDYFR